MLHCIHPCHGLAPLHLRLRLRYAGRLYGTGAVHHNNGTHAPYYNYACDMEKKKYNQMHAQQAAIEGVWLALD